MPVDSNSAFDIANNSTLTTNLNVSPYYDDYDSANEYYRILYKPGYAVQARELTQMQTMLQKQIDRFGKHVFREGSIVLPGAFTLEAGHCEANGQICTGESISYVRVSDYDNTNTAVDITGHSDQLISGASNYIKAQIMDVVDGDEDTSNSKTLFVRYLTGSNANTSITTFQPGEILTSNAGTLVVLADGYVANTTSTGLASRFEIDRGVFFAKENFIAFPKQSIILDSYNHIPSCKVGFLINEEIVSALTDASLLDPALEASNYAAPGADRLKLTTALHVTAFDDPVGPPDFVTLFTVKEGMIQAVFERPQYNILQDELAKRTFDESGDYYVRGTAVQIREHDDTGSNYGKYANGNNSLLFVGVDPGTLFVKGYEIGILDTVELFTEKSLTYNNVNSQLSSTTLGSYIVVNQLTGTWPLDVGNSIDLYDTAQTRLTSLGWSAAAQTGTKTGSAALASLEYASGTEGYDANYYVYLADIRMLGSNTFANVKSLYINNSSVGDAGADIILDSANNAVLLGINDSAPIYYVGSDFTRNIKTAADPTLSDTTFSFNRTEGISASISIVSAGTFSVSIAPGDEIFPYGTTTLSASDKRDIRLSLNDSFNIALPGTVVANAGNGGTSTLSGTSTYFTRLNVGDKIEFAGKGNTFYVDAITSDTVLTTTLAMPAGINGNTAYKAYKAGDMVDLTGKGVAAGTTRSVSATPTLLSFDLKETLGATKSATISYQLARTSAKEVQKLLKTSRFVAINCSSAGTTGPYDLGFSDIYRIIAITKDSSAPTYSGDGTDAINDFHIDRGQKDTHYDHGTITPKSALSGSDRLLIELDYFEPSFTSRAGYFSVDSYPVEDDDAVFDSSTDIRTENIPIYKSPVSGKEYDLRNHLDFRPIKTITASDTTDANTATSNPAVSTTFNYSTGIRFPVPSTELIYDYSYYLARKDLVVVNKDKQFNIIKGIPAVVPITPLGTDNNMSLAVLEIPPYPSLSPAYAKAIGRPNLASRSRRASSVRFTMKDIGVLKDRIVNLEYYTSLSLLEKQAVDMKILDENGLDRFKNGIFVDTFRDHLLGATYNPDYRITVDPVEKSIRPLYTMESFGYNYVSGTNVVKSNDIITLAYTEVSVISQNAATTIRNIERSSYRFFGNMTLVPDQDVWVDTTFMPDEKLTIGPTLESIGKLGVTPLSGSGAYALIGSDVDLPGGELYLTTTWNAWNQYVTGYNVYSGSGDSIIFDGTYATRDEATAAANRFTNGSDATIETLFNNVRNGTEQFLTEITDSATFGYKVTDTSIVPYIRSQTIAIFVRGLKPHTKMHVFFDNEESDDYCSPISAAIYEAYISNAPHIMVSSEGDDLVTNEDGTLYLLYRIDASKKYRFGSKSLLITDSPTNADDATTGARAFFNAEGLNVSKQKSILTTRDVIPLQREVQESYVSNAFETVPRVVPGGGGRGGGGCKSCLAYSILAKAPGGEEGIYLTSVDIYVSAKSATRGIWFEMREMNDGGNITRNALPLSEVWYNSADVPISTDGKTNPLKVTFRAPIFLYNNVQYAFVIHTEAIDPDYYLWVSHLGETDVNLNTAVNSRGMHGTLFTTNNNVNWDIVPDVDLTCVFRRAEFNRTLTGTATLGDKSVERFVLANVSLPLSARIGDRFVSGDTITIASSNGTILVSDVLIGNVSAFNASVVTAVSNTQYATTETGFSIGEKINAYYSANGLYRGISATVTAVANATATLSKYNETSFRTQASFINSNGKFKANDIIKSVNAGNTYSAQIVSIGNYRYSVASFEPSFLRPNLTDILFEMKPYSNTGTEGVFVSVNPSTVQYFNAEQALYSRSREISDLSSANSNQIRVTMTTLSNTVSPLLDLARTHNIYIDNLINSNTTNETASSGGELFDKYISRTITLADGQDAEDINVMLTSYRPPGTDVKVYVKILHAEDAEGFAAKLWTELEKTEATSPLYSSLTDKNDFKEFTYHFSDANKTGTNGEVQYTNDAGAVFTGYKYFAVKIGLLDDSNTAVVPRVADLRCVALQI